MRVSHNWLSDYVELAGVEPAQCAELLTLSGTEVERVVPFGAGLDEVVVGEVVELGPLAGSKRGLVLAKVAVPGQEPREVVCGAPNLHVGALVPWARPGTHLPAGMDIARKWVVSAWSEGMLCAPDELGLGDDHEGILLLDDAQPGQTLSELYPADWVYDLEILSNRADCLSHWGVARELAAALRRPLRDPDLSLPPRRGSAPAVAVVVEDPGDCPVYIAERFVNVGRGRAPNWIRRRLQAVGQRSLSGVVDLANYVMLDVGQPLHTFDLGALATSADPIEIGVRRGRAGERVRCLDGEERRVGPDTLLITARDRPAAIAGIIGGADTAIGSGSTELLLEAASFNWRPIRATSRRLGLRTEASSRFERFLSPHLAAIGAARFAHLLPTVVGGELAEGPVTAGGGLDRPQPISVAPERVSRLLGISLTTTQTRQALEGLGFQVEERAGHLDVTPPSVRTDVAAEVDVVEEVGRTVGYDRLEGTLPVSRQAPPVSAAREPVARSVAEICVGAGYSEAITLSLTSPDRLGQVPRLWAGPGHLSLANPLSAQLGALRVGVLGGLLASTQVNQARGEERVRLFELGGGFWPDGDRRPVEPLLLGLVDLDDDDQSRSGARLLAMAGLCQLVASRLAPQDCELRMAERFGFQQGRCAEVWSGGEVRGVVGEVDRSVLEAMDIRGRVAAAELRLDGWLIPGGRPAVAPDLPRTPALLLDLAVTVDDRAQLGPALAAVTDRGIPELERIELRDEYRGDQLGEGRKGWTLRLRLRDPIRTLTHADGDRVREAVLEALAQQAGAQLR